MGETLDTALVIGGAIAALYVLNSFKGQPQTKDQSERMIVDAGGKTTTTNLGTFWEVPGGVVKIEDGWKPNLAQKILVGIDATLLPGDWLTRKVFGA